MRHWGVAIFVLTASAFMLTSAQAGFVTSSSLNCRAAPNTEAGIIKRLVRGERVEIVESDNGWGRTQINEDLSCWVAEQFLADTPFTEEAPQVEFEAAVAEEPLWVPQARTSRASAPKATSRSSAPRTSRAAAFSSPRPRAARAAPVSRCPDVGGSCPCTSARVCVGPRGGRYCLNSTGSKRYGV
jgi:uncharacterized protein YgiM (DUF1202 family)